tara:strand:- start:1196 stop:2629 length:1434 start_codon:yes stop_codon:yes gene_type:complete
MNTILDKIFENIDLKKIAVIDNNSEYTYENLFNDCNLLIEYFKNKFGNNKKICISLPNCYISIVIFLISSKLNYKIFPINSNLSNLNINSYIQKYKFDIFIGDNPYLKNIFRQNISRTIFLTKDRIQKVLKKSIKFKYLKKNVNNITDNPYLIILSSGSTGDPKPIILSQKNKYLRSFYAGKLYKFNRNERIILQYELDHSVGQRLMFMSLFHAATLIITEKFNEELWYKKCIDYKITFSILVSTHIKRIIKKKFNLNKLIHLKNLVSVSDVLEDRVRKKVLKYNFNFHEIYGAAEISTVANIKHRKNSTSKSVGKILQIAKVKILKNKKFLKDGKIGEIICKTPLMFSCYFKKSKVTRNSFHKGYFKTGDLGYIKKNHIYFIGRIKNMFKVSGIAVYPEDIEKILKMNKYVEDCIIKSEYDEISGQKIIAEILGNRKYEDNIYFYCIDNLETFQIPSKFKFVENFNKTSLGKIKRN